MSRIPPDVIEAVDERSGGWCENHVLTLTYMGRMVYHHRKAYQMGATSPERTAELNVAPNIRYLHHECHEWWHRHVTDAIEVGVIVPQYEETPS